MTLIEAARQALPGIAWEEQTAHNGATWALGVGIRGHYSIFDVGDIAELAAELKAERDALDADLGETPRAKLEADLAALRERLAVADAKLSRLSQLADRWSDRGGYAKGVFAKDLRNVLAGTVGGGPQISGGG
jgi:hypothetical protein